MIVIERLLEGLDHLPAVLLLLHVDEVDDDDPAEIAQPQLARDCERSLEVGAKYGLFEIAMADVRAGIDVDRGHRLGLIDDQMAAGLQQHLAIERLLDLLFDPMQVEDRPWLPVQLDLGRALGHEHAGEFDHALVRIGAVDAHASDAFVEQIAQHAHRQRQILVHELPGARFQPLVANRLPEPFEKQHVGAHRFERGPLGSSTHDVAAGIFGRRKQAHGLAQAPPLLLGFDARGDADATPLRHVDEVARRNRDEGRQARALAADRILHHLHQYLVALRHQLAHVIGARQFHALRITWRASQCRKRAEKRCVRGRSR